MATGGLRARARRALDDEAGSLVLAMLATIVVGGLVTVVVASVITGQRSVRFDEDFTGKIHVAEAGIEQAAYRLNQGQEISSGGDGDLDGVDYEWTATELAGEDWQQWEVESTGGEGGELQRVIQAVIEDSPLFDLAAFSDLYLGLTGANNADSYNSDMAGDPDGWCTGNGRVGSNDSLEFSGGAGGQATCTYDNSRATVDGVDLFEWESGDEALDRCDHNVNAPNNCWHDSAETDARYMTHEDPVPFIADVDWMHDIIDDCEGTSAWTEEFRASDLGGDLAPADASNGHEVDFDSLLGVGPGDTHVYCVGQLIFDDHTALDGASPEDPVAFLVRDGIEVEQGMTVNCVYYDDGSHCVDTGGSFDATEVFPVAAALQIYSPSEENDSIDTGDVVGMRPQARFGGAVLAPRGTCGGVTGGGGGGGIGGAHTHVFGALICGDLRNAGGWQFHYDDALGGAITTGEFEVTRWSED